MAAAARQDTATLPATVADAFARAAGPPRVLHTRKGMAVRTPLTDAEAAALCNRLHGNLFARELARLRKFGNRLSGDQLAWMHKLALDALAAGPSDDGRPRPAAPHKPRPSEGWAEACDAMRAERAEEEAAGGRGFRAGQRIYWSTDSRHLRGTVLAVGQTYDNGGLAAPRPCGVRVLIDEDDRKPSWGEQPYPAEMVFPDFSRRLRPLD
jgi:hypothetical protein